MAHTAIDSLRKLGSASMSTEHLVSIVAVLDAIISNSAVAALGGFRDVVFEDPGPFAWTVVISSLLLLFSKCLYQKALQLSPLSLTIPYTSFTPAILVVTAFVLLGERPSGSGLCGVAIVAFGGYLLSLKNAAGVGGGGGHGAKDRDKDKPGGTAALTDELRALRAARSLTTSTSGTPGVVIASMVAGHSGAGHHLHLSGGGGGGMGGGGGGAGGGGGGMGQSLLDVEAQERRVIRQLKKGLHGSPGGWGGGWGGARWPSWLPQQEPGTLMMMAVAATWSVTASLDKIGVLHSPSIWVYFAAQRLVIGTVAAVYILVKARGAALHDLMAHPVLLLSISLLELSAVVLFLKAIKWILVSYVVAIKRCNILFSVLAGGLLFKENIMGRLPYIFLMLTGVMLIVLEPNALSLHHHAHTHHHRQAAAA